MPALDDAYATPPRPSGGAGVGMRRTRSDDDLTSAEEGRGAPGRGRDGRRGAVDAGSTVLQPERADCAVCGVSTAFRCAVCQAVFYCSRAHQRQAWREHKADCAPPAAAAAPAPAPAPANAEEAEAAEAAQMAAQDGRHVAWADGGTGEAAGDADAAAADDDEVETKVPEGAGPKARRIMGLPPAGGAEPAAADVAALVDMGFDAASARLALERNAYQVQRAAEYLIMGGLDDGRNGGDAAGGDEEDGIRVSGSDGPGVSQVGCSCLEFRETGQCAHLPVGWEPPLPMPPAEASAGSGAMPVEVAADEPAAADADWESRTEPVFSQEPPVVGVATAQERLWARVSGQHVRVLATQGAHEGAPSALSVAFVVADTAANAHFSLVVKGGDVDMLVKTHFGSAVEGPENRERLLYCLVGLMQFERTAPGERRLVCCSPSGRMLASSRAVQDAGVAHALGGEPEEWTCALCTFVNTSVRASTACEMCGTYAGQEDDGAAAAAADEAASTNPASWGAGGDPDSHPAAADTGPQLVACPACGHPADVRLGNTCRQPECGAML